VGSRYLTDMAEVLRIAGLQVVELAGWETRARGSGGYDGLPCAVLWHHTASSGDGASDADYCTFGSDDAPVCNLVIGRDGLVYVCAAGATNTNGKGGPLELPDGRVIPQDSCNSRVIGVELSNDGVGMPWPEVQLSAAFTASAALTAAYVGGPDQVAQHSDWAPTRKVDPATAAAVEGAWQPSATNSSGSWALADLRAECLRRAGPSTGDDDDMTDDQANEAHAVYVMLTTQVLPALDALSVRVERIEVRQQTGLAAAGVDDPTD
jgi:hypothetical protein